MSEEVKGTDTVVGLPMHVIAQLVCSCVGEDEKDKIRNSLKCLCDPWSVVYQLKGVLDLFSVESFQTRDEAGEFLESLYNLGAEVIAVLHNGKPRKFRMQVKARWS